MVLTDTAVKEEGDTMAKEKPKKPEKTEKPEKPEKPKAPEKPAEKQEEKSVVFIGRKPVMNYVIACLTSFNAGAKVVVVKARGRAISTAVDTEELLRRSFARDVEIKDIGLGTEEVTSPEGQKRNVSTIEISLAKAESG